MDNTRKKVFLQSDREPSFMDKRNTLVFKRVDNDILIQLHDFSIDSLGSGILVRAKDTNHSPKVRAALYHLTDVLEDEFLQKIKKN